MKLVMMADDTRLDGVRSDSFQLMEIGMLTVILGRWSRL